MNVSRKLSLTGLVALVFGLVVGVGIFNLPQNMAHGAGVGAVTLAWLISGAGILTLVLAFKVLSDKFPNFKAGIYEYAEAGFGQFTGFNAAWGYWLCSAFSNVAFAVILNDAVGAFFPVLLRHSWPTVLFGSVIIWVMYAIVARGIQTAKVINTSLAVVKVCLILMIVVIFCTQFDSRLLLSNVWAQGDSIGSVLTQTKESMMVTLFCFFGIEGAVMLSARAKRPRDVGRAGIIGFVICLVLYMLVSVLCFGLMPRAELAALPDPSIAYILRSVTGEWAYYFVVVSLIIALLGGWVAWTLVVAQVPYEAAKVGIMPRRFLRVNRNGMPTYGLFTSSIVMEIFLLLVIEAQNVYLASLRISGLMILPCYLFTALYLWRTASSHRVRALAIVSTLFCLWMIYAGGLIEFVCTSVFYLVGLPFYIIARRDDNPHRRRVFTRVGRIELALLIAGGVATVILAANGLVEL